MTGIARPREAVSRVERCADDRPEIDSIQQGESASHVKVSKVAVMVPWAS